MNRRRDRGEPLRSGTPEHAALETELRDWMARRADAVTPATLRAREVPLPAASARRLRVPLRPAVAAVAAIVVVAAAWMVTGATSTPDGPRPVTVPPAVPAPPTGAPVGSTPPSTGVPSPSTATTTPPTRAAGSNSPMPPQTIPGFDRRTTPPENQPPRTAPPSGPAGGRRTG
ncbi:hypothetical protein [Embleya sp. MST-111070]|uniref:hypothetical protein n=1 Tax=Embleya sp. MST-111070 TaxID=3398231 RepID=UPI003F7365EC